MFQAFGNPCLLSMHDVNVLESAGVWGVAVAITPALYRRGYPTQ